MKSSSDGDNLPQYNNGGRLLHSFDSRCREVDRSPHQIDITIDGKPFTTYYFDPAIAKPYLMPLRTASGAVVTRDFPVRNDASKGDPKASAFEPHQRPLYFGHGDVEDLDFWQEPAFDHYYSDHGHQAYGHMVLKSVEKASSENDAATVRARFTLNDPSNRVIAEETQTFSFRGDAQTRVIDCEFVLYATAGSTRWWRATPPSSSTPSVVVSPRRCSERWRPSRPARKRGMSGYGSLVLKRAYVSAARSTGPRSSCRATSA